jgi:hypothetical protein
MKDDEIVLGNGPFEMHSLAGVLLRHPLKVGNERFLAITNTGIVLDVNITGIPFDGFAGLQWLNIGRVEVRRIIVARLASNQPSVFEAYRQDRTERTGRHRLDFGHPRPWRRLVAPGLRVESAVPSVAENGITGRN